MRPNVLLVILDAARRDALEPYGAAPGSTPAIAQLASSGTAMPDVYSTACWTVPSHASLFTGLLPRAAGLSTAQSPSAAKPVVEAHRDRLLPEVLRRAGYRTGAVSANLWLSESSGFASGFDDFASIDSGRNARLDAEGTVGERLKWMREAVAARADDGAQEAGETLAGWIARPTEQPSFWFVNLLECHSPYLPPRPYGGLSAMGRAVAAEEARRYYTLEAIWRACAGSLDVPERTLGRMRQLYAGAIRYLDDWLAQLLERLATAGTLDDTLVVVASDHGENFGEGGFMAHAHSLDNRLIHVPFVASGPGADGTPIHSLADVPRFIAEAVGLEDHPWQAESRREIGVAQFDPPVDENDPRVAQAAEEWNWGEEEIRRFTTPLTCAVAGGLKVLRRGTEDELYDLGADPLELAPLRPDAAAAEQRELVARLRHAIDGADVSSRAATAAATQQPSEDEVCAIEEQMKLLGYM